MGMLYRLEEAADRTITSQMQEALQSALDLYKVMCESCNIAMARHHSYSRLIVSKYGELRLRVPVFRCTHCGDMGSGMELIGSVDRGKRYSKNARRGDETGNLGR